MKYFLHQYSFYAEEHLEQITSNEGIIVNNRMAN